jgi:hypothetical protein
MAHMAHWEAFLPCLWDIVLWMQFDLSPTSDAVIPFGNPAHGQSRSEPRRGATWGTGTYERLIFRPTIYCPSHIFPPHRLFVFVTSQCCYARPSRPFMFLACNIALVWMARRPGFRLLQLEAFQSSLSKTCQPCSNSLFRWLG